LGKYIEYENMTDVPNYQFTHLENIKGKICQTKKLKNWPC